MLAISVAQVDQMSGGRAELGLGAGWFEAEHAAYGLNFPDTPGRFDLLTEQLELITGLWDTPVGEKYDFTGKHYQLKDSPALPKPVQQPHPPIIVGGAGKKRTPALAAQYAAEFNAGFKTVEDTKTLFDRVQAACTTIGRDPKTLALSAAHRVAVGKDKAEVERRAANFGWSLDQLAESGVGGTPAEIVDHLGRFAEARRRPLLPPDHGPHRPGPPGTDRVRGPPAAGPAVSRGDTTVRSHAGRRMIAAVRAKSAAAPARATGRPATCATSVISNPQITSPRYSACARNECVVARTSLVVRALTQIIAITRVSGTAMPDTRISAAAPLIEFGANARPIGAGGSDDRGDAVRVTRVLAVEASCYDPQGQGAEDESDETQPGEPDDRVEPDRQAEVEQLLRGKPAGGVGRAVDQERRQEDHAADRDCRGPGRSPAEVVHDAAQRRRRGGTKRSSLKRATTYRLSSSIADPGSHDRHLAPCRPREQLRVTTSPVAAPDSWARAVRDSTAGMRSGAFSSSVIQAMSEPLAKVHDSPHSICVASSGGNEVTRPVVTIAVPIRTATRPATTSGSRCRPVRRPAPRRAARRCPEPAPMTTSSAGDSPASTTR